MQADRIKIRQGTKEVDQKTFFDHNDDTKKLLYDDFFCQPNGNGGAKDNDIDDNCMELDGTKI
ncbi:hypothetical protein Ancab_001363, partial [Ancistrocladus abbreviatus]